MGWRHSSQIWWWVRDVPIVYQSESVHMHMIVHCGIAHEEASCICERDMEVSLILNHGFGKLLIDKYIYIYSISSIRWNNKIHHQ